MFKKLSIILLTLLLAEPTVAMAASQIVLESKVNDMISEMVECKPEEFFTGKYTITALTGEYMRIRPSSVITSLSSQFINLATSIANLDVRVIIAGHINDDIGNCDYRYAEQAKSNVQAAIALHEKIVTLFNDVGSHYAGKITQDIQDRYTNLTWMINGTGKMYENNPNTYSKAWCAQ
jgi:hypothetical protein